jgi:hypothetical protein
MFLAENFALDGEGLSGIVERFVQLTALAEDIAKVMERPGGIGVFLAENLPLDSESLSVIVERTVPLATHTEDLADIGEQHGGTGVLPTEALAPNSESLREIIKRSDKIPQLAICATNALERQGRVRMVNAENVPANL